MPIFRTSCLTLLLWACVALLAHRAGLADTKQPAKPKVPPKEATTEPLPAEKSITHFKLPDGLTVDLIAAEPIVEQPLFLNFDERGRMWVLQYRQYPKPAGLKMVSKDKHLRAVYDKVPMPPGHPDHVRGEDKITIHEDTNGDGKFDKVKTFVDGLNIATSFAHGRGGVWVLNPPYLLFCPDKDRDDVPDGPPVVHLEGFGLEDTHSVVNSLRWGPDGWLYAAQGSTVSAHVKRPGIKMQPFHSHGQLVWRYHPEKKIYEIFAEGGGNIWSCVFDSAGRLFGGTNGTPRGYHYVQGAYYRKNFIKHGELSNPYSYGYFQGLDVGGIRLHNTITLYEGGALPSKYEGTILGCNPLASLVDVTRLDVAGSTFTATDEGVFIESTDRWFRPVDAKAGPDGAVYIADWYDQQVRHPYNYAGRISKKNGRIYRVRSHDAATMEPFDLGKKSNAELINLLKHRNRWFRATARRLLADRRDPSILPRLRELVGAETGQLALEAFWVLNLSGGFAGDLRETALRHANPHVRCWAIRLIGDERKASDREVAIMTERARSEANPEVRSQIASTARRLPVDHAISILQELLARDADAADPFQPLMVWWALESKCHESPDRVIELFEDSTVWQRELVKQFLLERLMRRLASTDRRTDLVHCAKLLELSPNEATTALLLKGFERAYRGRSMVGFPLELNQQLDRIGGGSLVTRLRRGDRAAVKRAIAVVGDRRHPINGRIRVIEVFGEITHDEVVDALIANLDESAASVVHASVVALQAYSDQRIASAVIRRLPTMSEQIRAVGCSLLSSRAPWATQWIEAVKSGKCDEHLVPPGTLVDMHRHKNTKLDELIQAIWGKHSIRSDEVVAAEVRNLTSVIGTTGGASPHAGREIFLKKCATCHILYNEGGKVGPDLTGYRRQSLESLLGSIVNPSAEIREGFERHTIVTVDGRVLSGLVIDQNQNIVVLRPASGQELVVRRKDMDEFVRDRTSLMPAGLLEGLKDQQVRDLFAYLRTGQPLNIKGTPFRDE